MASTTSMTILLYNRLVSYMRYLQHLPPDAPENTSSAIIGAALNVNDVQVRKDLAIVSSGGKPKTGYNAAELLADLSSYLGCDNNTETVLVGVGNLGKALLCYKNFSQYGLKILAAFDTDLALIGTSVGGIQVMNITKAVDLCKRLGIRIGIITAPASAAQSVCDALIEGGVKAIWNFAPINLQVPDFVVIRNEDIAASLAVLTRTLAEKLNGKTGGKNASSFQQ